MQDLKDTSLFWKREVRNNLNDFNKFNKIRHQSKKSYVSCMNSLNKTVYCLLRSQGLGKEESSFLISKFRNIKTNSTSTKKVISKPKWYDEYVEEIKIKELEKVKNEHPMTDDEINQVFESFRDLIK